ncbi:MAG: trypsin-like peptidase domain-containing protein [Bacteroidetes bacterium]|nr:trypsin-like peptidase domain-containing protein [Bacteroidota bacterium]MBS1739420.1 trypsin-like peptidase domain-containing protein [Bacteroidota bacterium]
MKSLFILFTTLLLFSSCKQRLSPPAPEKLYEDYRKSVVLVKVEYYYQINFSNGITAFFTQVDNDLVPDLSFDEAKVKANPARSFGTGFFISNDGKIATNRHVSSPSINGTTLLQILKQKYDINKEDVLARKSVVAEKIDKVKDYIVNNASSLSYTDLIDLRIVQLDLDSQMARLDLEEHFYDFDPTTSTIVCKPVSIKIAYDNTFVTNENDYSECVLIKSSSEEEIDLSILQLKNKTTPTTVSTIFTFDDHNQNVKNGVAKNGEEYNIDKPIRINTKVYMIGYNYGTKIGNTTDGLKSQLTQGTVSQESDNVKVLYSIPSLQGSSGSPIIDEWGNLLAVNFAKVSNSQSFNYGVIAKHLKHLLNDN